MNNRKKTNKRGKNPRSMYVQIIKEADKVKGRILNKEGEEGEEILVPNPRAGQTRRIYHINSVKPKL